LSYENNAKPALDQLQEHLGLDAAKLKKVVLGLPAVLEYVPAAARVHQAGAAAAVAHGAWTCRTRSWELR
jgi:hypothetical protein